MVATIGGIIVNPDGVSTVVTFTLAGATPAAYTAAGGSETHSLPTTITSRTGYYFTAPGTYVVSAKQNGVEIAGDATTRSILVSPDTVTEITVGIGSAVEEAQQDATRVHIAGAETVTGAKVFSNADITGILGLGTGQACTIASGVATVTKSFVVLDAEGAGTSDQLDTITMAGAAAGDLLLLTVNATDTITVDDANINLGAATRAIAPGGSLLLFYDGTEWTELFFTAATDNA